MTMKTFTWKEAFIDASKAAQDGIPIYQTFVGYCFCYGKGTKKDLEQSKYWYGRAAKSGELDAIFSLAVMNDQGLGIQRNAASAIRLYRKAAMRGHLESQSNLAVMLLEGDGTKQDVAAGFQWLRKAAYRGDPVAQFNLGKAYALGENVRESKLCAQKWLSKSFDNGYTKAGRLLKSIFSDAHVRRRRKKSA
jgi:uncharacterized protein